MLTKEEAIRLVNEHSSQEFDESCGHTGCEDHLIVARRVIHCLGNFTGADWDVESVKTEIRESDEVRWVGGPGFDHGLAVVKGNRMWRFAVPRPADA